MAVLRGSNQFISMILKITKARVVVINKDKFIGRMNKLGKKFRLYWMGKYPSNHIDVRRSESEVIIK